jgi:hypothetical protein
MSRHAPGAGSRRGQAIVEFALVLPLLIVVLVGLFDFGRGIYAHNTISQAARTGARLAIVNQDLAAVRQAASDEAVALDIDPDAVSPTPNRVDVTFREPAGTTACSPIRIGCVAVVSVHYRFEPATPVLGSIIGPVDMEASSEMRVERVSP